MATSSKSKSETNKTKEQIEAEAAERKKKRRSVLKSEISALKKAALRREKNYLYLLSSSGTTSSRLEVAFHIDAADDELKELFAHYDLSPEYPFHWRVLLEAYAREVVRKRTWTQARVRRLAVDVYLYHIAGGNWNARKAAEALMAKKPWSQIADLHYMEKLIGEQNKIVHFNEEGSFARLARHYGGPEVISDEINRIKNGTEFLPWEEDDWFWD